MDFDYADTLKRVIVDTVLRLLGTRLLTDEERADTSRSPSTGLQATNQPNLFIYYEHQRPQKEAPIQEKYILFVSREMKLPAVISPQKIEEVSSLPPEPEILEKGAEEKNKRKTPGIFETINKVLLGDDEGY